MNRIDTRTRRMSKDYAYNLIFTSISVIKYSVNQKKIRSGNLVYNVFKRAFQLKEKLFCLVVN